MDEAQVGENLVQDEDPLTSDRLARHALTQLAMTWQVDEDAVRWTEQGFDWWPGDHRVSVTAQRGDGPEPACRLSVATDFLAGVDLQDAGNRSLLLEVGVMQAGMAVVFLPPDLVRERGLQDDGSVHLRSTVYVQPSTARWLPRFLAGLAILQPVVVESMARQVAEAVGGRPSTSRPEGLRRAHGQHDSILDVVRDIYLPAGREPSRWDDCDEFAGIVERIGSLDLCFGTADGSGVTLETPIGEESALVSCRADTPHPWLGSGLLTTVSLPFARQAQEAVDEAMWLNLHESFTWTDVPQLGSWHARAWPGGGFHAANACFLPNALHAERLATNCVLWRLGLARWVRNRFWPHLQDLPMQEILRRRLEAMESSRVRH